MSDPIADFNEQILKLTEEKLRLENQLTQYSNGFNGLLAQIDAHKQYLNDVITNTLVVRTNLILLQKQNQDLQGQVDSLKKQVNKQSAVQADAESRN